MFALVNSAARLAGIKRRDTQRKPGQGMIRMNKMIRQEGTTMYAWCVRYTVNAVDDKCGI